ncbi:MAG: hypothetical protein ACLU4J_00780 [Butyricimonas paravirosa]
MECCFREDRVEERDPGADFPKDDPTFDPDNLKYSCIRYVPAAITNAMGPSWTDPRTGEIINASVIIFNDVVKLANQWRFLQTSQVDPSVRTKKCRIIFWKNPLNISWLTRWGIPLG